MWIRSPAPGVRRWTATATHPPAGACSPAGSSRCRNTPRVTRPRSAPITAPGIDDDDDETEPRTAAVFLAARTHAGVLPRGRRLAGRRDLPGRDRMQQAARTRYARLDRAGRRACPQRQADRAVLAGADRSRVRTGRTAAAGRPRR